MNTILPGTIGASIGLFLVKVLTKTRIMTGAFLLLFPIYLLIHSFIYLLFFRFIAKSSSSWLHNKRRRVGWGVFGFVVQSRTRKSVENKDGWLASVSPANFAF